ncbi:trans-2,3-dihydro-3-hydroxyanthranilate isomerase [Frankia sp. AiPs1]|uniref:PhzF family phenazine biosynthesis protein n=1 Tax=Frankia sp. AiPa1 TaxID=573492 RepID=UPI00202AD942|nr:PhzF family phenazine biosynthesis protein [Frankia sp. AiPa1]MCL9760439.1 PhzF family phenazine biosynthesis protein [Frankia sp. AiPa1]
MGRSFGRPFRQVDVFTATPLMGNPVAVVLDAAGLDTTTMQAFARWTNLSETTFVLPPRSPEADYRIRIFTPSTELPFAGHPTLGSCHAWLEHQPDAATRTEILQECDAGLISLRRTPDGLAFAAPPLRREGPVDPALLPAIATMLGISTDDIVAAAWADNGPGWIAILLDSAEAVLALRPRDVTRSLGVVGPWPTDSATAFEIRAFFPQGGATVEDPVTGSLNAAVAQWLLRSGRAEAPYVASQGTALQRAGRVHISVDAEGTIWVGGGTVTCLHGTAQI